MTTRMKEVRETKMYKRDNYIHIETDGCIVNIRPGLYRDEPGEEHMGYEQQKVTVVEVIADGGDDCDPSKEWVREGDYCVRVVKQDVKPTRTMRPSTAE